MYSSFAEISIISFVAICVSVIVFFFGLPSTRFSSDRMPGIV